ncbi:M20/M25/M40 family metallo-hydrolase [Salinirubrum litoreum]|uniref:M20/M25/M40 family metallo-hydrolase n=1 Tax=Salinirubrum litoreum TaxID=1126234 RepID=A0ABD5R9N6_9EURY
MPVDDSDAVDAARDATEFDPIDFLEAAVQIDSSEDVTEMRAFLVETLADHGIDATVDDAGNTLATRESSVPEDGPHIVLNTHIDTVRPHVPFARDDGGAGDPAREDVIRGRGSCDAKGPLAALLAGFLATEPARGRLTLAVTPDEETLSLGADALDLDADAYVVGEPTGLDVCTAAKGRFQGTVTLSGVAAHAAEPESGVNAVAGLEGALRAIRTFDATDASPDPDPQLGGPTLTPTTVSGGESTNQVPAEAELVVDRRSVPPETAEGFRSALESHVRAAITDEVGVDFALTDRESPFLEAFATTPDAAVVRALQSASGGEIRPFGAATEASYFAPAPTVVFGPGVLADDEGAVAHAEREYVRVSEVRQAGEAVQSALATLLG